MPKLIKRLLRAFTTQLPGEDDHRVPRVLELRIHGVHNTPPAAMLELGQRAAAQVSGDAVTGIYRDPDDEPPVDDDRPLLVTEAYSWGALTSAGLPRWPPSRERRGWRCCRSRS